MDSKKKILTFLVSQYKDTVSENLNELRHIVSEFIESKDSDTLLKNMQRIINQYSNIITKNWSSGRKYLRTGFALEAFKSRYPKKFLILSLSLDTMINIMDDLLDEKISKEDRAPLIEELIRISSIYNSQKFGEHLKYKISNYFNKILSIFFIERVYEEKIEKEKDTKKIIEFAIKLLDCQSSDIDIFIDIPLSVYETQYHDSISSMGRIFRALNLLKKGIIDLEHDKKQNTWTFTAYAERTNKLEFYSKKLIEHYLKRAKEFYESSPDHIVSNLYKIARNEAEEIKILLKDKCQQSSFNLSKTSANILSSGTSFLK